MTPLSSAAEWPTFGLEDRLSAASAETLAEELRARRGENLAIDAGPVRFIATPCVQVLLAAARSWRADARGLRVVAPSGEFTAALAALGLDLNSIQSEATECH